MLTKEKKITQIEIVRDHIQVKTSVYVKEDGVIISETYERVCYAPDSDIESLPEEIKPYALIAFNDEAKARYELTKVNK